MYDLLFEESKPKKKKKTNTQIKQNKDLELQRKKYVVARWEGIGGMNEINEGN